MRRAKTNISIRLDIVGVELFRYGSESVRLGVIDHSDFDRDRYTNETLKQRPQLIRRIVICHDRGAHRYGYRLAAVILSGIRSYWIRDL